MHTLGLTREHLRNLYQAHAAMRTRRGAGDGAVVLSRLVAAGNSSWPADDNEREELRRMVDVALRTLDRRAAEIVRLHFGLKDGEEGLTLEEIGQQFGLTKERVRQIEARSLEKLRHVLRDQADWV
jgi:RNA polymerase sigma factor (sigma-70 family)